MIGNLPDTLEDRARVVQLKRKDRGDDVERMLARRFAELLPVRRRVARWVADNGWQTKGGRRGGGVIVTNPPMAAEWVVHLYNRCGSADEHLFGTFLRNARQ